MLQAADLPLDELAGRPDYERAEEVEGGVDEGGDQGEGGGGEGGDDFGDEEEDVSYYVDLRGGLVLMSIRSLGMHL